MPRGTITLVAVLLTGLVGCAPRFDIPPGYVALRNPGPHDMKAASARGSVLALKARPNENAGADLAFWSQALEHQKVDLDGLKLADREPIQSGEGLPGMLFRFELGEGQGQVTYLVALYVTPQRIYTLEAGGATEALVADLDKLRAALLSLHTR